MAFRLVCSYPCEPGKFSINPQNKTCDACPEHANVSRCSVVLLGFVWVPSSQRWPSAAWTLDVHTRARNFIRAAHPHASIVNPG